jgi:hypothetical protein
VHVGDLQFMVCMMLYGIPEAAGMDVRSGSS